MHRVTFTDDSVSVWGWPSRGGVIVLSNPTHIDFDFLGLSTTIPPLIQSERHDDSTDSSDDRTWSLIDPVKAIESGEDSVILAEADRVNEAKEKEDMFCRQLLLLGAKWFDSCKRLSLVHGYGEDNQPDVDAIEQGLQPEPTLRERRWVRIGWESHKGGDVAVDGGFWILDCDTNWTGIMEEDNLVPIDAGRLILAKTMKDRCEILRGLGARYYPSLAAYDGRTTFLKAFEWKKEGEVGPLQQDGEAFMRRLCITRFPRE